jgi:hypothetical protein
MRIDAALQLDYTRETLRALAVEKLRQARLNPDNRPELQDFDQLLRDLNVPRHKPLLLRLLPRRELEMLLYLLKEAQLVNSLFLFPKSQLLWLIRKFPKKLLLKMLFYWMDLKTLLKKLPRKILLLMLMDKRLKFRRFYLGLTKLDPNSLRLILKNITGQDTANWRPLDMHNLLAGMDKHHIVRGMQDLPMHTLIPFVMRFIKEDPRLLENIPDRLLLKRFDLMEMPTLVQSFNVVPKDKLIELVSILPQRDLTEAVGQIDTQQFEQYLKFKQGDLLKWIAEMNAA